MDTMKVSFQNDSKIIKMIGVTGKMSDFFLIFQIFLFRECKMSANSTGYEMSENSEFQKSEKIFLTFLYVEFTDIS